MKVSIKPWVHPDTGEPRWYVNDHHLGGSKVWIDRDGNVQIAGARMYNTPEHKQTIADHPDVAGLIKFLRMIPSSANLAEWGTA